MKLKRIWCFALGWLMCLLFLDVVNLVSTKIDNWYKECDSAYGYTTDYYTCRNYYIKGGK